jgi:hypothetical protein
MKPKHWINSQNGRLTKITTQFLPLPKGEGRGEGEENVTGAKGERKYN